MTVLLLEEKPTEEQISQMSEEFKDYVKVVVDVEKRIISAGGRLHTDCESLLLKYGSRQENLWGGGVGLLAKKIDCTAITNIRPSQENDSMEILDPALRKRFFEIVKNYFIGYEE
ncbi:MAG: DUF5674 family protein [Patescibacteria group bacterium]